MNFRNSINHFFQGRYGTDSLNRFLLALFLMFMLLYLFTGAFWMDILCLVLAALMSFRMLSKDYERRSAENQKFLQILASFRSRLGQLRNCRKDSAHRICVCPHCQQKLRVPKGKGKIRITCPRCRSDFIERS